MTGKTPLLIVLVLAATSAACGRKKPAPAPVPISRAEADSIARDRARLDSVARIEASAQRAAAERARNENLRAQASTGSSAAILKSPIFFELDESALTPEAIGVLEGKLALMQENAAIRVRITGHTDNRGSDEYNLALGQRRAAEARRFFTERGIAEGRVEIVTRGEEEPAAPGNDEASWARNRRAEFLQLGG